MICQSGQNADAACDICKTCESGQNQDNCTAVCETCEACQSADHDLLHSRLGSRLAHPMHYLAVEHVQVSRDGKTILKDISFHVHCGDIVALIGPNGGGKSTLLKALAGEMPYTGRISFTDRQGLQVSRPRIGYMMQHLQYDRESPVSVSDLLCANRSRWPVFLGPRKTRREEVYRLLQAVEAETLIDKSLGVLSGGELQRVLLAFALDPVPDILLLDEPVAAMDRSGRDLFYRLVRQLRERYDLLIMIVSHDLDVITDHATSMIYLDHGIQAAGSVDQLLKNDGIRKVLSRQEPEVKG